MNQIMIEFEMDRELKERCEQVLEQNGLDWETATTAFFKECVRLRQFPFEVTPEILREAEADPILLTKECELTVKNYLELPYRMEIIPDAQDGGFVVCFPELPGCITCVQTWEEISAMALDAKKSWMEAMFEMGMPIPMPKEQHL